MTTKFFHQSLSDQSNGRAKRPKVSLVVPAYNEETIIADTLNSLQDYMAGFEDRYLWELIVVDDGSTDRTAEVVQSLAERSRNIRLLRHRINFGLGQALKFAFNNCSGDYIVTLDADLTYGPAHIEALLDKIQQTRAKIVIASPYFRGGKLSGVPWHRKILSIVANKFLSATTKQHLSTITSMVRVYDAQFLQSLPLKSTGMDVMPEIIYKSAILGALIEEIPAHLDWRKVNATNRRRSSVTIVAHTIAILFSGFLFRPLVFFVIPGALLLIFSVYVNAWMVAHFIEEYSALVFPDSVFSRASVAVGIAYTKYPHTFVIGLLSLMLSIQLIGLGMLSAQNKSYFEEIFHLGVFSSRRQKR